MSGRKFLVELEEREVRAVHFAAGFVTRLLPTETSDVPLPEGYSVYPLEQVQMKLEALMIAEHIEQ